MDNTLTVLTKMKIEIEKITWNENKDELAVLLNQLPKWRLEKALSYHFDIDKYLCLKHILINHSLKRLLLIKLKNKI